MTRVLILLGALLSVSSAFARADVSLRNGNFFVSLRDISYPGGMEPKIERVYNSKSDFHGMFGYSWGTEYETRLSFDPDGSLLLTEYGGGANIRFSPKTYSANDVEEGIKAVVNAAQKAGTITSAKGLEEYRRRLKENPEFRSKQYGIFVNKGVLQRKMIAENTQFISTDYQYQYLTRVKGGYTRVMEAGVIQKFNEAGRLAQIMDRNRNFVNFSYDSNGRVAQMIDNQNRKMMFSYNQYGLVERITGESGKKADFKYSKEGFLVYSKDDAGVENTFKYTADQYRNLSEIGYPNERNAKGESKRMIVTYYGPDKNSSVKSVLNLDGTVNEYEYELGGKSPGYYAVRVVLKDSSGAKLNDSKYEYFYKTKASGEEFTARMVTTVDGEKTETVYDEKLGYPLKITANGKTTTMEYDLKGRMTRKVTPLHTTTLTYDPVVGKVSKVVKKVTSGTVIWSEFEYDKATGNLLVARNSDKKLVKLIYDAQGRISALVDQAGRQLTFKYNELSKPVEIRDAKLGTVKFTYKNSGEVDKVDSNGGASVSVEVMRALQSLIDITAPAGVTMSI